MIYTTISYARFKAMALANPSLQMYYTQVGSTVTEYFGILGSSDSQCLCDIVLPADVTDFQTNFQPSAILVATINDGLTYLDSSITNPITEVAGAATTAAPTYTTATTNPLSLDTSGNLRVKPTSDSDINVTGHITALNGTVVISTNGMSSVVLTLTGTWVATVGFQGFDGTNWITASGLTIPAGGITEALSANGSVLLNCGGFSQVRLIATAFTSGTVNVFMNAGSGSSLVEVYNDSQNPIIVAGTAASGTADTLAPVKIGAVYTNPLPVVTTGQRVNLQCDPSGRLYTAPTPNLTVSTFGTNGIFTFAGAATDIFTIYGSATKTIKITRIDIDGTATATSINNLVLIKRVAVNTGGTFTALVPTRYDTNTAAATCTVGYYTANPTALGTPQGTTGILAAYKTTFLAAAAAATDTNLLIREFQKNGAGPIVLNAATEGFCINMNGATVAGNSISINIEWTEE